MTGESIDDPAQAKLERETETLLSTLGSHECARQMMVSVDAAIQFWRDRPECPRSASGIAAHETMRRKYQATFDAASSEIKRLQGSIDLQYGAMTRAALTAELEAEWNQ